MLRVRIQAGHIEPAYCTDPDKHEGLRTSLAEMKQHLIDVHGFEYFESPVRVMRHKCSACSGTGWIESEE